MIKDPGGRVVALVLLIGAVILLALAVGYLGHPTELPADPGTPAEVTTIGRPR